MRLDGPSFSISLRRLTTGQHGTRLGGSAARFRRTRKPLLGVCNSASAGPASGTRPTTQRRGTRLFFVCGRRQLQAHVRRHSADDAAPCQENGEIGCGKVWHNDIRPTIRRPTRLKRFRHPSSNTEITTVVNADATVILRCFPRKLERGSLWLRAAKHLIESRPQLKEVVPRRQGSYLADRHERRPRDLKRHARILAQNVVRPLRPRHPAVREHEQPRPAHLDATLQGSENRQALPQPPSPAYRRRRTALGWWNAGSAWTRSLARCVPPNESRISCVVRRPQSRKNCSASSGRRSTTASCAC